MIKPVSTKAFLTCLRELRKKGKEGKKAHDQSMAAQAELANFGEIQSVKPTKHGESRIPNVRKYDLSDYFRLVVQVIDAECWAFLFVGDHGDADRWLDNHKNYKWVRNENDKTLDFVQVSDPRIPVIVVPTMDVDSPESLLQLPLLRDITDDQWTASKIPHNVTLYLKTVTAESWEQDPNGVLSHIEQVADLSAAMVAADLLTHAHHREWDKMHRRLGVAAGEATVVEGEDAAEAMLTTSNSEQFVTWQDVAELPSDSDWADWMLFMHPEQKEFASRDFNGPARLRGVSGSGKTCVMVHRARRLAKLYKQNVLLVTLTESMRQLLDILVKAICGAEATHIRTKTMNSLAMDSIEELAPGGLRSFRMTTPIQDNSVRQAVLSAIRNHVAFPETVLSKLPDAAFQAFVLDECNYVRMRFLPDEYEKYLSTGRQGRAIPLPEKARAVILAGVSEWDAGLNRMIVKDYEGVVQHALSQLSKSAVGARNTFRYRCVLVDEVQDLTQLELRILAMIPDATGKRVVNLENGLYLVGDGAQSIYSRGFVLKHCGISVANRSFVLQKNYRNTKEILGAAYDLISPYKFADIDEENIITPTAPHLSSRHGERPYLVKASSQEDETAFVVEQIRVIIEEQKARDDADDLANATEIPICVVGFNSQDRDRVESALKRAGIPAIPLREGVAWSNHAVKISTVESAKGHEFHAVFIVGVNQGAIPNRHVPEAEWKREAARLYVGMTRARDRLYVSYISNDRHTPSPFLASIQNECVEFEWKRGRLMPVD